jgi:hypothetical protein
MSGTSNAIAGWREWVALPELGIARIKAKLDTGARTSALHAFSIERFRRNGEAWVTFDIHPMQGAGDPKVRAEARVVDERRVSDSGGHREKRLVIATQLVVGDIGWPIELTLANRDSMRFRLLIGRAAMRHRLAVDPGRSYLQGESRESK